MHKNILVAVIIVITPGGRVTIGDERNSGVRQLGERPVALVAIESVSAPDVCLEQIEVAVIVVIDPRTAT